MKPEDLSRVFQRLVSTHLCDRMIKPLDEAGPALRPRIRQYAGFLDKQGMRPYAKALERLREIKGRIREHHNAILAELDLKDEAKRQLRETFKADKEKGKPFSHADLSLLGDTVRAYTLLQQETLIKWAAAESAVFRTGKMLLAAQPEVEKRDQAAIQSAKTTDESEDAHLRAGFHTCFFETVQDMTQDSRRSMGVITRSFRAREKELQELKFYVGEARRLLPGLAN
jgi:hypothetical protein